MTIKELENAMLNGIEPYNFDTELAFIYNLEDFQTLLDFAQRKGFYQYTHFLEIRIKPLKKDEDDCE